MSSQVDGWTDSKYFSFIRSALRKAWLKYPNRYRALNEARLPEKVIRKGRRVYVYECNCCKGEFTTSNVVVDHIEPCGRLETYEDFPSLVSNMFCELEGLQVLCKQCHYEKTMDERGINPLMAAFKKLKAKAQREELKKLNLPEGKNLKERIAIYKEWLDEP